MRRGWPLISILSLLGVFTVVGGVWAPSASGSEQVGAAEKFRALFLKKIYAYTTAAQSGRVLKVCLAYDAEQATSARQVFRELEAISVPAFLAKLEELPGDLDQASAVLFFAKKIPDSVKELVARNQALSAAASVDVAERGDASIGLGINANRFPDVVVHLPRLKAEGQRVPATLLSMSMVRVVRE